MTQVSKAACLRSNRRPHRAGYLLLLVAGLSWPGSSAILAGELSMRSLAWLSGCWARTDREAGSGEVWTTLAGGTLLGVSRTVSQGQTVSYEFLEIRPDRDGQIQLIAHPSGQAVTRFALVGTGGGRYVFENPDHDFPQRIVYQPAEDGSLAAWIEGSNDGQAQRIDFPMQRMECSNGK